MRWDATGGTIQREFPDRNSHTIGSEIPQSENAASVRHDNDPYIFLGPVVHHRCHQSPVLFGKVHSPGSTKPQTHFLAGLSDRGSVNQGSHFFDVVDQDPVVQGLVGVVQILKLDVFLNVRFDRPKRLEKAPLLHGNVVEAWREQPPEPETVPFLRLEGDALVEVGVVQNVPPARPDLDGCHELAAAAVPLVAGLLVDSLHRVPGGDLVAVVVVEGSGGADGRGATGGQARHGVGNGRWFRC
mmetsp:Transcript_1132/g.2884  ORF Transcript_1132/g.2884 Transcript_1132/m.2884 type:complete len:242 (-) Transcript_1132:269-994(-)